MIRSNEGRLGCHTPAFVVRSVAGLLLALAAPSALQAQQSAPASQPLPGAIELSKMVWSTMLAIDHANRAGNYSVLRDLGAPGFQANNDAAQLASIFASLRGQGVDLSNTVLLAPSYSAAPAIIAPGVLRLQGTFGLRPTAISFDIYYQWDAGRWKLFGVSIIPIELARVQPAPSKR